MQNLVRSRSPYLSILEYGLAVMHLQIIILTIFGEPAADINSE